MAKLDKRDFGSIRKLPSGNHQARYTGPDLRRHSAPTTFKSAKYARRWLDAEEELIERGTWVPPDVRQRQAAARTETMREFFERIVERRVGRARKPIAQTTADLYRKDWRLELDETFGDVPVASVTRAMVGKWWDQPTKSPTQKGRAYDLLRSIMNDAVDDELIEKNPVNVKGAGKPAPAREGVALSVAELHTYLAAVPDRYRLMLMISGLSGLRSGEVRALRRKDVDLKNKVVHVRQAVSRVKAGPKCYEWRIAAPKTAAGVRSVAIPEVLLAPLRAWLQRQPVRGVDALVFPAYDGKDPIQSSVLHEAHMKGARAVGKPAMTVHDLRRTAATLAAQQGATLRELMHLLGHTTAGVAMIYQSAEAERDRQRADRLNDQLKAAGWG